MSEFMSYIHSQRKRRAPLRAVNTPDVERLEMNCPFLVAQEQTRRSSASVSALAVQKALPSLTLPTGAVMVAELAINAEYNSPFRLDANNGSEPEALSG